MKIKAVTYDIIALDPRDNSYIDQIDGEFETWNIAHKYFEAHCLRNIAENHPDDRAKLVIRKITRSFRV